MKKEKKIHYYKKTIYFVNGNMKGNLETDKTLDDLEEYYAEALEDDFFIETDEEQNKTMIFNSKNVIGIEIIEIKGGEIGWTKMKRMK